MPSIAIVGTEGCGKTVFFTVLAKALSVIDDDGRFLNPHEGKAITYVEANWHTLTNGDWPESTRPGDLFDLIFTFHAGGGIEFELRFIDTAGQDLRQLFMGGFRGEENAPEALKALASYCQHADIVLFMINLKDFIGEGDAKKRTENQIVLKEAIGYLKKNKRPCCVLFTQADQYNEEVIARGGWRETVKHAINWVYGAHLADGSIPFYPVSAVNKTTVRVGADGTPISVPAKGFKSDGLETVLFWLTERAKGKTPLDLAKTNAFKEYETTVQKACELFKEKKFKEASDAADKALALVPNGANAVEVKSAVDVVLKANPSAAQQVGRILLSAVVAGLGWCFGFVCVAYSLHLFFPNIDIVARLNNAQWSATGFSLLTFIVTLGMLSRRKCIPVLSQSATASEIALDLGNGLTMSFLPVEAGTFDMGSPLEESERHDDETQHRVTISKRFFMGKFAVTQQQYEAVMGNNPSHFKGKPDSAKRPVEQVSWNDAVEFCQKVSEKTGKKVDLPTEAQWEYACRAGTKTPFHTGETINVKQANYDGNFVYGYGAKGEFRNETVPVGSFKANAWGFHDMHGNVWEWCRDAYLKEYERLPEENPQNAQGDVRVVRGGSWKRPPSRCRSAHRGDGVPDSRDSLLGFRVVIVAQDV